MTLSSARVHGMTQELATKAENTKSVIGLEQTLLIVAFSDDDHISVAGLRRPGWNEPRCPTY
jgi:hypothetical protein